MIINIIVITLVFILAIIAINLAEKSKIMEDEYYNAEERALIHFKKLMKINKIIKEYESEGKSFISVEDIKKAINEK